MPNTYACKGVFNPNIPYFHQILLRVCTLVLFIFLASIYICIEVCTIECRVYCQTVNTFKALDFMNHPGYWKKLEYIFGYTTVA